MSSASVVLVVAAHPDDEVLGCGGTIARHVAEGDPVHVLLMGDGVTSRAGVRGSTARKFKKQREVQARDANRILGSTVELADLPDNRFDAIDLLDIVRRVEKTKQEIRPQIVYTHHGGDLNVDHRLVCQGVLTAFRPQPGEICRSVYFFEVNSTTEWQFSSTLACFRPQRAVDISAYWNQKAAALECYTDELRSAPHPRSLHGVRVLAEWRGSTFGMSLAETFELGYERQIILEKGK